MLDREVDTRPTPGAHETPTTDGAKCADEAHRTAAAGQVQSTTTVPNPTQDGQDHVERPPLVGWGGWHLVAGGKDRGSGDLWKKIAKLSTKPVCEERGKPFGTKPELGQGFPLSNCGTLGFFVPGQP